MSDNFEKIHHRQQHNSECKMWSLWNNQDLRSISLFCTSVISMYRFMFCAHQYEMSKTSSFLLKVNYKRGDNCLLPRIRLIDIWFQLSHLFLNCFHLFLLSSDYINERRIVYWEVLNMTTPSSLNTYWRSSNNFSTTDIKISNCCPCHSIRTISCLWTY